MTALGHVHLEVRNLERSVAYYRKALGLEVSQRLLNSLSSSPGPTQPTRSRCRMFSPPDPRISFPTKHPSKRIRGGSGPTTGAL